MTRLIAISPNFNINFLPTNFKNLPATIDSIIIANAYITDTYPYMLTSNPSSPKFKVKEWNYYWIGKICNKVKDDKAN